MESIKRPDVSQPVENSTAEQGNVDISGQKNTQRRGLKEQVMLKLRNGNGRDEVEKMQLQVDFP